MTLYSKKVKLEMTIEINCKKLLIVSKQDLSFEYQRPFLINWCIQTWSVVCYELVIVTVAPPLSTAGIVFYKLSWSFWFSSLLEFLFFVPQSTEHRKLQVILKYIFTLKYIKKGHSAKTFRIFTACKYWTNVKNLLSSGLMVSRRAKVL